MAMSLAELLAEEGFKRRKAKIRPITPLFFQDRSMPLYMQQDKHKVSSIIVVEKTERMRSEIPQYDSKGEFSTNSSLTERKPRDNLSSGVKIHLESKQGTTVNYEARGHRDSWNAKRFSIGSSNDLLHSEITEVVQSEEIVEVEMTRSYKDIYLNKVYNHSGNRDKHSAGNEEKERHRNNIIIDNKKDKNNSFKHSYSHPKHRSFKGADSRSMKQSKSYDNRSNNTSKNKNFSESRSIRHEEALVVPTLDEVAVKAIISIFSGYAKRFVEDEDFRTSLHHNSFASLNLIGLDEGLSTESKVIRNLEQAIEIVEKAAEKRVTLKELKKASLQLSVITGLNSNDLKNRFTYGIPNLRLSACAHLYLSVIYVLQKKDGIAAKHLLQVFCNSPFQARTNLLPDLWDRVFLPHLLYLKVWYDKETHHVADSPILTNLKLVEKVYNESLDSGTYQFAMYYKDWITDGVEAPSVPFIRIPSFSFQLMPRGGFFGHTSSPASHVSPQPMVNNELYDEVFRHSHKAGVESKAHKEENLDSVAARSSKSLASEDKQLILYTHDSVTQTYKRIEPLGESLSDDIPVAEEEWRLHIKSSSGEANLLKNYGDCQRNQKNLNSQYVLQAPSPAIEDKLLFERPQNPVLELKQFEDSVHQVALRFLSQDAEDHVVSETELKPSVQEVQKNYEYARGNSFLCSVPEDFLCPMTGLIFKDPVTLETGQTFEREAIINWFGKGCITCPITKKTLQCQVVPPTNLILKRVIDKWKIDHIEHPLALLSQVAAGSNENIKENSNMIIYILGQLLPVFNKEERVINTRRVISFGGLQFLIRRFNSANTEEKTFILTLLCCCIEADVGCRKDIARNINQSNLLELLHDEQLKSRTNAVLLLIELICFNRRSRAKLFLEGLLDEEIINAMDHLNMYLHTCPLEQTPLVAVLILHLDLLSERHAKNIYRQEAVDALTVALKESLSDEKVQKKCSRALLILGGFFSSSGKLMTEDWILKLAGFLNGPEGDIADDESNDIAIDGTVLTVDSVTEDEDEETAREKWLVSLSASLLGDGNKSFLDAVSKCLSLGNSDLVRVCLTTVAWLSFSLASLHDTKFQLCAFSALISPLKQCLEHGELVEQKILASLSLLNFSTIPECRILLMKIAEEIGSSLDNLAEVTWTAKELYAIIFRQRR